jgi:hypothetical protein
MAFDGQGFGSGGGWNKPNMANQNLNAPATKLSPPPVSVGFDQRVGGRSQTGGRGQAAKGAGSYGGLPPRLPQALANKLQKSNRKGSYQKVAFGGRRS